MTIEKIQEECKRRYPVGTRYICPSSNTMFKIEENYPNTYNIWGRNSIDGGFGRGYLYNNGKFAEIVSTPQIIVEHKIDLIL